MRARTSLSAPERLLRSLGVDTPKGIDLDLVAYARGARVFRRPLEGAEAHIQGRDGEAAITVNVHSSHERQRYSLAHELGHWHHHRGQKLFCRGDEQSTWHKGKTDPERTADAYAADLLMPSYLFVPRAETVRRVEIETMRPLAKEFETSLTATVIRFVERGPFPAAVVWYDKDGAFGWKRLNHRLMGGNVRLPPRVHHDAKAFELLYGTCQASRGSAIRADTWLMEGRFSTHRLIESCVSVLDGVLVLLWFSDHRLIQALS